MPAQSVPFCEYDGREIVKGLIVIDQADGSASWFCSYGCLWAAYTPLGMPGAPAPAVVAELAGKMDPERAGYARDSMLLPGPGRNAGGPTD